jgi:hypothetical protein
MTGNPLNPELPDNLGEKHALSKPHLRRPEFTDNLLIRRGCLLAVRSVRT